MTTGVAQGVGGGIGVGVLRLILDLPLTPILCAGYAVALCLTVPSNDLYVSVAWCAQHQHRHSPRPHSPPPLPPAHSTPAAAAQGQRGGNDGLGETRVNAQFAVAFPLRSSPPSSER
jgi:hypothetical protein